MKGYDGKCEELATYFLQDEPDSSNARWNGDVEELAPVIQDAVEDWFRAGAKP